MTVLELTTLPLLLLLYVVLFGVLPPVIVGFLWAKFTRFNESIIAILNVILLGIIICLLVGFGWTGLFVLIPFSLLWLAVSWIGVKQARKIELYNGPNLYGISMLPILSIIVGLIAVIGLIPLVLVTYYIGDFESGIIYTLLIIAVSIPLLGVILSLILGLISLWSKSSNNLQNKYRAKTGIALGVVAFVFLFFLSASIPSLVPSRIATNEDYAIKTLKQLVTIEEEWKRMDYDGNGKNDYWTYDVSCLCRMHRAGKNKPMKLISDNIARADYRFASDNYFGQNKIESWGVISPTPTHGYFFIALKYGEDDRPYNSNQVSGKLATNTSMYGFAAIPAIYATSGVNIFIVNQAGVIYATDAGSHESKWLERWPGPDPVKVQGPGDRLWWPAE